MGGVHILKILYEGKTKTVFDAEDGNVLLKFKDDVTGEAGTIDPGGNSVVGQVEGKGNASLRLSKHFFEILEKAGIPTHFVDANVEDNTMLVKKADAFGTGLEFVCRIKAAGSFLRRYGKYAIENQPLGYLVEITLKDDQRGDPLINEEAIINLGLMTAEEIEETKNYTKKATQLVEEECKRFNLELIDIKFEFGRVDGKVVLIDEVSGDNMRIRKDGQSVMQKEFCSIVCG
jgi:phosphoribosylaminoimidazole-succinocarboxamide synthase